MLLNPGHGQGSKALDSTDSVRRSSGFAGLVRHVVELCALGELPIAQDEAQGAEAEAEDDSPIGCAIEYSLPDFGHVSEPKCTIPYCTVLFSNVGILHSLSGRTHSRSRANRLTSGWSETCELN